MEEDSVLVVGERVVDLLVPNDTAARRRNVDHLQPECVPHQVVREHHSPLQPGVGPSVTVWVGDVELGDCDGVNLVRGLGNSALHRLFVLIGENRRHGGVVGGGNVVVTGTVP